MTTEPLEVQGCTCVLLSVSVFYLFSLSSFVLQYDSRLTSTKLIASTRVTGLIARVQHREQLHEAKPSEIPSFSFSITGNHSVTC